MKKALIVLILSGCIVSCAKTQLQAPCANYGKYCSQVPINSEERN